MPELEAEMAALRSRAELAEGSAAKLEESLLVGWMGGWLAGCGSTAAALWTVAAPRLAGRQLLLDAGTCHFHHHPCCLPTRLSVCSPSTPFPLLWPLPARRT